VVIVIEGVDRFSDQDAGKEANIAFWLPERFPKNVKVIVSARRHSESIQHLERIGCEVIDVKSDAGIADLIRENIRQKTTSLKERTNQRLQLVLDEILPKMYRGGNVYCFLEFYSGVLLPKEAPMGWIETLEKRLPYEGLAAINNVFQLFNYVIDNSAEVAVLKAKFESALIFLALAQKGITTREMLMLSKLDEEEWIHFLGIFGSVIVRYGDVFSIKARWLVEAVL
jgi:hypothetical protein